MQYADIFKYMVAKSTDDDDRIKKAKQKAALFTNVFIDNVFDGVEFYLYHYIQESVRMDEVLSTELLGSLMNYNLKKVMKDYNVKTASTLEFDFGQKSSLNEAFYAIQMELQSYMETLQELEVNFALFKPDVLTVKEAMFNDSYMEAIRQSLAILDESDRKKIGTSDAIVEIEGRLAKIKDISKLFDKVLGEEPKDYKPTPVTTYGINRLDKHTRGLFTTEVCTISGISGSGKTTYVVCNPVYNALTLHKKNVIYFSVEQTRQNLENMLIVRKIYDDYGKCYSPKAISIGDYDNDLSVAAKIKAIRLAMFEQDRTDNEYGYFVVPPFEEIYTNTLDKVIASYEARLGIKFDIVVIDYMSALEHKYERGEHQLNRADLTKEGYAMAKRVAMEGNKSVIVIEQLTKEGIEIIQKGADMDIGNLAGGQYTERYSDIVHVITGTKEEKANNIAYLDTIKTRTVGKVPRIKCRTNLMVGDFKEMESGV